MKKVIIVLTVLVVIALTGLHAQKQKNVRTIVSNGESIAYHLKKVTNDIQPIMALASESVNEVKVPKILKTGGLKVNPRFIIQLIFVLMIAGATGVLLGIEIGHLITSIIDWDE